MEQPTDFSRQSSGIVLEPVLVILAFIGLTAVIFGFGFSQPASYLPDGSVRANSVIDYIERDGSLTICIADPDVPAPKGHPCQAHGH